MMAWSESRLVTAQAAISKRGAWTSTMRRVWGVTLACGLGVAAFGARTASAKDRYDPGEEVPAFTLKVVNAEESGESYVSLDKYFGAESKTPKKAILVSFFATYCEPCKREIPYLAALYDTYKDKGLQVLLITIDKDAPKIDVAKELAQKASVKFPLLSDRFNIVARRYFIEKLPCVYVLNAQGKVSLVNVGYTDDVSRIFLDEIRKNIGEPTSDPVPEGLVSYLNHGGGAAAPAADHGGGEAVATADDGAEEGSTETAAATDGGATTTASDDGTDEDDGKKKGKKKKKRGKKKKKR
jgi:alkyl hydroperoxide reductase subunit AhpC